MKCPQCQAENPADKRFCGSCGATLQPARDRGRGTKTFQTVVLQELASGSAFAGRYQVIEELGKGGMGRVYKVLDEKIKEKVALKLLKPEISSDEAAIERFSNELRFARKIAHRNVCRMYDLGEDQGTHFITMEYVSGEDLKSILRMTGPMSAGKAVYIARQVCEGLAEAHRLGVVHRDLKPQNVMIDREGNARIMDFGIARSLKVKGMTGAGVVIGTPEYMSPEQVEGGEADSRSDIYSLGIILYEILTGHVPFEGETFLSVALKQKTEAPRNPKELNAQIPEDLNRLVMRCLEKDRSKRYQKVEDILTELSKIEKGVPTTEKVLPKVRTTTSREITVKFTPKKLVLPGVGLVVLIAAVVLLFLFLPRKETIAAAAGKPSVAVMYFENNTGETGLDQWRKALSELLITDLSQSKYLNVLSGDRLFDILNELKQTEAKSYSASVLKEVAGKSGADYCLRGGYTKAGDSFRINYMLQRISTAETLGSGWVAGQGEASFYPMVDELTKKVKADFKLTAAEIASDPDKEVGIITTTSPEALRFYTEGREYHHRHDLIKSIELMQKAVAIDPGFAMAYRSMAVSYNNAYLFAERDRCLQKAIELSDRVSDKERYLIQADYYGRSEKTEDQAFQALNKVLETYPDDSFTHIKLAYGYLDYDLFEKAIAHASVAVANKDRTYYPYSHLAWCYYALGRPDKAKETLDLYFRTIGDDGNLRLDMADYHIYQGQFDKALEEVEKALVLNPANPMNFMEKGDIYLFKGDLERAAQEYARLLKLGTPVAQGNYIYKMILLSFHQGKFRGASALANQGIEGSKALNEKFLESIFRCYLAYALWRTGNGEEAVRECERAGDTLAAIDNRGFQRWVLQEKGVVCAAVNDLPGAQATIGELLPLVEQCMDKGLMRMVDHLRGAVELQKGNTSGAIAFLKKAISYLPYQHDWSVDDHAFYFDSLAAAYFKAGELEKSREQYEKILSLTTGRISYGDIYARSFYWLGRIFEQQGRKDKASENYRKFLELWNEADPGLAELADAQKKLSAL